jgi:hypothetical protein
MESLAVMLGCLAVFAAGMVVRCALMALVLGVATVPFVAVISGVEAAEACWDRSGGLASVHEGLRCKATQIVALVSHHLTPSRGRR